MKRFFVVLAAYLAFAGKALAGVSCTLPFTLVNGTLADATQVMANYNALVTCLNTAASAGANTDITSLAGLTTPLSPQQGGTSAFIGGTSTGTANAQVVASTTPNTFQPVTGYRVIFKAGFTNTGPLTLNVDAQGVTNVFRRTSDGVQATVGGEVLANAITEVVYDGTQFQLIAAISPFPVGTVLDTIAAASDAGFLLMQGQCISTTTFAALWAKMGSPVPGSCAANNFALPDGRGRVVAMIDSGGSGRITAAGGNFDGTVLYGSGGAQGTTIAQANLPNISLSISNGTYRQAVNSGALSTGAASGAAFNVFTTAGANYGTIDATVPLGGSGTVLTNLPPILMLNRQIKY